MVWTQEQMIASYGNAMPESYYDGLAVERDQFVRNIQRDAENWSAVAGREVSCEVVDYLSVDRYRLEVHVAGFGVLYFTSTSDVRGWIDRMFPAGPKPGGLPGLTDVEAWAFVAAIDKTPASPNSEEAKP